MKRLLLFFLLASLFSWNSATAQRTCATNEVLERLLRENPEMRQNMEAIEAQTREFSSIKATEDLKVITIPVVVHIVWNTEEQNISDAQVHNQLEVLNNDFRRMNADAALTPVVWQGIAADCKINFCLASQTPEGDPTTGIERRQTIVPVFSSDDAVKYYSSGGLDIWDRNRYLNIWVCNLGDDLLGYAQFPGGPAATDGVVIAFGLFGTGGTPPYNQGRTSTHEIGHWLNLRHIWGDDGNACYGSDYVTDTPNQAGNSSGCPAFPTITCFNYPNGNMFMNYMDYTDDACMNLFTMGQRTRMRALFANNGRRESLLSSPGCEGGSPLACGTPSGLSISQIQQTSVQLHWNAVSNATSYTLEWRPAGAAVWTAVSNIIAPTYLLTGLSAGTTYEFRVKAVCGETSGNFSAPVSFTTLAADACMEQYEPNNSQAEAVVIPVNAPFLAQVSSATDKDWYRFSNTAISPNIKVELTGLPADYDMKLYRGSVLLGTSQHTGTTDEIIIRNTTVVGDNYYVYVYGYNGAWDAAQCYTLQVSLSGESWSAEGPVLELSDRSEISAVQEIPALLLSPNPASDLLTVTVPVDKDALYTIEISGMDGQVLVWQYGHLSKSANRVVVNLERVPEGAYLVRATSDRFRYTQRIIVYKSR